MHKEDRMDGEISRDRLVGKRILLTGTTGFVGKAVLEKLLREVPEVGSIVLLLRGSKRYADALERFEKEVASSSVFERLRSENPEQFQRLCDEKLEPISAEVTQDYFGLEEGAFTALAQGVDLVINCAASVNFREPLDKALQINTYSLNALADFCLRAKKCAFLQVSTCYVHGHHTGLIGEKNHPPATLSLPRHSQGYFEVADLLEELQYLIARIEKVTTDGPEREEALTELGARLAHRHGWNDVYTFTKWIGEQVLFDKLRDRPLTILRPAIVESALAEPVPGWIEGVKVADALILAYARGKAPFFPGDPAGVLDIIPVDRVANAICVAAMELVDGQARQSIYQVCSGSTNPVSIRQVRDCVVAEGQENHAQYKRLFRREPSGRFRLVSRPVFFALLWLNGNLARWQHSWDEVRGKVARRRALDKAETVRKLAVIFAFYTVPNYVFENRQLERLHRRLDAETAARFPVAGSGFDWVHYLRRIHIPGLNRYALSTKAVTKENRR